MAKKSTMTFSLTLCSLTKGRGSPPGLGTSGRISSMETAFSARLAATSTKVRTSSHAMQRMPFLRLALWSAAYL